MHPPGSVARIFAYYPTRLYTHYPNNTYPNCSPRSLVADTSPNMNGDPVHDTFSGGYPKSVSGAVKIESSTEIRDDAPQQNEHSATHELNHGGVPLLLLVTGNSKSEGYNVPAVASPPVPSHVVHEAQPYLQNHGESPPAESHGGEINGVESASDLKILSNSLLSDLGAAKLVLYLRPELDDTEDEKHGSGSSPVFRKGNTSDAAISPHNEPLQTSSNVAMAKGLKFLKKNDGEPFLRKDIQLEFLECLFNDQKRVFTNSFPRCEVANTTNFLKLTFAELYLRAMFESQKSSKVLRESLIKDPEMGKHVSMVCLLVNANRINTNVNFSPAMQSASRTFNLIPSLQYSHNGVTKPLQDTLRLKSILKAVCGGEKNLQTLLDVVRAPAAKKPNINVVKLISLMSIYPQEIPFHYDDPSVEQLLLGKKNSETATTGTQNRFMEFFLDDRMSPKSRAQRLLWLLYTYLETSFTPEEVEQNPFNPRVIPPVEYLTEEEARACDVDTESEVDFAKRVYNARVANLGAEPTNNAKRARLTREKTNIKKQLLPEKEEAPDEDTADELMHIDAEERANEGEPPEAPRTSSAPRPAAERLKRKKPTPSVGFLIDCGKQSLVGEGKWKNPTFPLARLDQIRKRFLAQQTPSFVKHVENGSARKSSARERVVSRLHNPIDRLRTSAGNIDKKRDEILLHIHRYFHYKKDTRAGLLGIEWEDIRSDLVNGIETYLYQQLGKELLVRQQNDADEEDKSYGMELELAKRPPHPYVSDPLLGDVAAIDIGEIEKLGEGYLPEHDFDRANERLAHNYAIVHVVSAVLRENIQHRTVMAEECTFNLDAGTMLFK